MFVIGGLSAWECGICVSGPGEDVRSPKARVTGRDETPHLKLRIPAKEASVLNSWVTAPSRGRIFLQHRDVSFLTSGPQTEAWAVDSSKCTFYGWSLPKDTKSSLLLRLIPLTFIKSILEASETKERHKGSKPQTDRLVWQHQWSSVYDLGPRPTPLCPN